MIRVRQRGTTVSLPIRDEEIIRMGKEAAGKLFLPYYDAECLRADAGGFDIKDKLPEGLWVQEMNMLAFVFTKFDKQQMEEFQRKVKKCSCMYAGEMLNLALSICPEAAGMEKGSKAIPLYTGENLFELMEYKRFLDRRKEYPEYQIVKFYLPVGVDFYPRGENELDVQDVSNQEAAIYQAPLSELLEEERHDYSNWGEWQIYMDSFRFPPYQKHGLLERHLDMEVREGELWAVIVAEVDHLLKEEEIQTYKEMFQTELDYDLLGRQMDILVPGGKISVRLEECTEVYQQGKGELTLTEREMFWLHAPHHEERLQNKTGFVPDFRDEWEYHSIHPVWLELFKERKRIRISLPADESAIKEGMHKIGAKSMDDMGIWFKQTDLIPGKYERLSNINLEELNLFAEGLLKLNAEERKNLWKYVDDSFDFLNPLPHFQQMLERALIEKGMENTSTPKAAWDSQSM